MRLCKPFKFALLVALALGMTAAFGLATIKTWRACAYRAVGEAGVVDTLALSIRGTTQYLFVRGYDRSRPLLLFLPGGPGESFVPLAGEFSDELEHDFIVVHIENGGFGKSTKYTTGPTLEQMVEDTGRVVDHLLTRFDRKALYLVGHSFGSILALKLAQAQPQKVLGVATVGQAVDWRAGNRITHEHLLALARKEQDNAALADLAGIAPDLSTTAEGRPMIDFASVKRQREWLEHYGLNNILLQHTAKARWFTYLGSPNHTLAESCDLVYRGPCKWIADPQWWSQWNNVLPGVLEFNAARDVPQLEIPYIAIVGSNDWITPGLLTRQYFDALIAPEKRFIEIPGAQHYTFLDKPHEFQQAVRTLLSLTHESSGQPAADRP